MYTSKNSVSVYVKQKPTEIKGEIDKSIIMIRKFNILFPVIDRTSGKASKDTEDLNNTINLTDIYIREEICQDWLVEINVLNKPLNSGKHAPLSEHTQRGGG